MSGIVGIINLDGAPADRALLERMTQAIAFRGPDAQAVWLNGAIGLGHALLRTTFEAEHERGPCSLDGQVWITADARVDDRAALICELRVQGRNVADDAPDPELILHAYHVWGENCLDHLIGDFAFAIWNGRQKRLFCARDHFGVAPFYYAQVNRSLVISNTLQVVRLHPDVSDELNERAIGDYLLFRGCHDLDATTFVDIHRLPPAHSMTWTASDCGLRVQRYWSPPERCDDLRYKNPDDYVERFRELFQQAVADRLRTDRVAVTMSGGLDSPSVAAVAHKVLTDQGRPFDLHAYTLTYTLIPHEEGHYAKMVASALGFPIHYIDADESLQTKPPERPQKLSPELNFTFSWWVESWVNLWAQAAATGRVLLTGYGGDPVLYPSSYWIDLLKRARLGRMVTDLWQYVRTYGHRPPLYLRSSLKRWLGISNHRRPYPPWLDTEFGVRLNLRARLEQRERQQWNCQRLRMAADPFWSNLMTSWDPGNTHLPLKARFPFFDLRLVTYLMAVPSVPWFEDKRLLREAMRGVLPEAVRQRRKTLLTENPVRTLVQQQDVLLWMEDLASAAELAPYVDQEALLEVIRSPEQVIDPEYRGIAQSLILAYWLRHRQCSEELVE